MSPSGLCTTRSSTHSLRSTLPSILVVLVPIKRRSVRPTQYEDCDKEEPKSKTLRTYTGKRSSGVSSLRPQITAKSETHKPILTRSAAVTKPASKAVSAAPKASAKIAKSTTHPQPGRITRSADLSIIAQNALAEIPATYRMRLEELKAASNAADSKGYSCGVEASFKTGTIFTPGPNRITRSAIPAPSKVTKVTKITKDTKLTATPNKKLGKDKKSSKVAAASKAPISARTRSQAVTGAQNGKKKDTA
ncbi:hypothetical protein FPQ18DRAFT_309650 [Pyronema domesticum]|nr:hypothetical protein FPQ18DRAFT_309650 [Pyronema domesticum]